MGGNKLNSILKFALIFVILLTLVFSLTNCILGSKTDPVDWENVKLVQLEKPEENAPIAIIQTNYGEMRAVLYPQYAPETVNNFISLAQKGYYDGTYVFGVQKDTFFMAGTPNKDGSLNDDYDNDNENLKNEVHDNLWPLRGAICSVNGNGDRAGSRFIVCNSIEFTEEVKTRLYEAAGDVTILADAFIEHGGIPNYSRQYSIIAQVYEGLDIIEKICDAEAEGGEDNSLIPKEDIMIEKITISEYTPDSTPAETTE